MEEQELQKLNYKSLDIGNSEHRFVQLEHLVGTVRSLTTLLIIVSIFLLFLNFGWWIAGPLYVIISIVSWVGVGMAIVGNAKLDQNRIESIRWLNVAILLIWGRYWCEIVWWTLDIMFERTHFFEMLDIYDLLPLIPFIFLTAVTSLLIKLNIKFRALKKVTVR